MQKRQKQLYRNTKKGIDYTPAIRYLYKKVGTKWGIIWNNIESRLPKDVSIFCNLGVIEKNDYDDFLKKTEELFGNSDVLCNQYRSIRVVGAASYWKKFYVDEFGYLQFINPDYSEEDFKEFLEKCTDINNKTLTYTFEGKPFKIEKHD